MADQEARQEAESPPGPSRREERRRAIIEAAESLFFEQGYEATSLAAVVKRSGGSLATLYELFGNKQGLLRAIVEYQVEHEKVPCLVHCSKASPRKLLTDYAHQLYQHCTSPRSVAITRIVMTEALSDPDFARSIYEDVHLQAVRDFADLLAEMTKAGRASIDDPLAAAALFFDTVIADGPIQTLLLGTPQWLSGKAIEWRLEPFLTYFNVQ